MGETECGQSGICYTDSMKCDGVNDCLHGEDEISCSKLSLDANSSKHPPWRFNNFGMSFKPQNRYPINTRSTVNYVHVLRIYMYYKFATLQAATYQKLALSELCVGCCETLNLMWSTRFIDAGFIYVLVRQNLDICFASRRTLLLQSAQHNTDLF